MNALALVTGATSGIGRAFADRLAADGYDLIAVGRDTARLADLVASHPNVTVRPLAADLATPDGIEKVAATAAAEPVDLLVNNAGVAHYMPFAELPAHRAAEVVNVKILAAALLARAVLGGMLDRGAGTIINVGGMIAFSGPAPSSVTPRRAVYGGALAYLLAFSQLLAAELEGTGVRVQALLPGVVATEFHTRQGIDLSGIPRMSAEDVVTASLRGLELGETVTAPGVADPSLLDAAFAASLAAFGGQRPELAARYRS